jgi:hypothetical protein
VRCRQGQESPLAEHGVGEELGLCVDLRLGQGQKQQYEVHTKNQRVKSSQVMNAGADN